MDHSCHQCGGRVEDGVPFCPQCGAPQIRVSALEHTSEPMPPGTPGEVQPPAEPLSSPGESGAARPAVVDWQYAVRAAAAAGLLLAVAWAIPFIGFFLWMLAAGVFAVFLYCIRRPAGALDSRQGAKIGALAGLFGFGGFAVLMSLQLLLTRSSGRFRSMVDEVIRQSAARNPDPRAQEILQKLTSPEGLALMVTIAMVMFFVLFLALSSLGGMLGAKLFRGRGQA